MIGDMQFTAENTFNRKERRGFAEEAKGFRKRKERD
jgi:hypothetical protein